MKYLPPTDAEAVLCGAECGEAYLLCRLDAGDRLIRDVQYLDQHIHQQWVLHLLGSAQDEVASLQQHAMLQAKEFSNLYVAVLRSITKTVKR